MKNIVVLTLVLLIAVSFLPGCSGIQANAEYSLLIDRSTAWSIEAAERAERGELTEDGKTQALRINATNWTKFRDAKNGKAGA